MTVSGGSIYLYEFIRKVNGNDAIYYFVKHINSLLSARPWRRLCHPSLEILFCSHKNLQSLEQNLNMQLHNVNQWLCANKLSLNIDKSNFVIFHPPQKKIEYTVKLQINNKIIEEKKCIKYLGIFIDCHLNWKEHVHELSKK